MKLHIFILLALTLSCCSTRNEMAPKTDNFFENFQLVEDKMKIHYDSLEKNRIFEDSLGRIDYLFRVVKKEPHLYSPIPNLVKVKC